MVVVVDVVVVVVACCWCWVLSLLLLSLLLTVCSQPSCNKTSVGDVRSVLIGATRCDDKCENTDLLESQGPCGSVRRCRDDTVTHDANVQKKWHTRNSWRHFRRMSKNENWLEPALQK